jgi:hypothetical protein
MKKIVELWGWPGSLRSLWCSHRARRIRLRKARAPRSLRPAASPNRYRVQPATCHDPTRASLHRPGSRALPKVGSTYRDPGLAGWRHLPLPGWARPMRCWLRREDELRAGDMHLHRGAETLRPDAETGSERPKKPWWEAGRAVMKRKVVLSGLSVLVAAALTIAPSPSHSVSKGRSASPPAGKSMTASSSRAPVRSSGKGTFTSPGGKGGAERKSSAKGQGPGAGGSVRQRCVCVATWPQGRRYCARWYCYYTRAGWDRLTRLA